MEGNTPGETEIVEQSIKSMPKLDVAKRVRAQLGANHTDVMHSNTDVRVQRCIHEGGNYMHTRMPCTRAHIPAHMRLLMLIHSL